MPPIALVIRTIALREAEMVAVYFGIVPPPRGREAVLPTCNEISAMG